MGPEIRDQWIRYSAQRFTPCLLRRDRITRDSQDLAIQSLELVQNALERGNLTVSGRRKSKRMKGQHDVLSAVPVA